MSNIQENNQLEMTTIDPELDRLYREHAIAAAITTQTTPISIESESQKEIDKHLEPLDNLPSTFGGLE